MTVRGGSRAGVRGALRVSGLAVAGASLALVAAACGSSAKSATGSSAATTVAAAPTTAAASPSTSSSSGSSDTATVAIGTSAKLGQVLVNAQGRTLYTFDPDSGGTIACTGGCATTWPPDVVSAGTKVTGASGVTVALATVSRPEGTTQVTAGGHPLYTYVGDKAAGDTNGDGLGGKWHAARPTASASTTSSSAGPAPGY